MGFFGVFVESGFCRGLDLWEGGDGECWWFGLGFGVLFEVLMVVLGVLRNFDWGYSGWCLY